MSDALIDIRSLEREAEEKRQSVLREREKEIIDRWMSLLTSEYIRATINESLMKNRNALDRYRIYLIDEAINLGITIWDIDDDKYQINIESIIEEVHPPYKFSIRELIESRVDTKSTILSYGKTSKRLCVALDARNEWLRTLNGNPAEKMDSCVILCGSITSIMGCLCCCCCKMC